MVRSVLPVATGRRHQCLILHRGARGSAAARRHLPRAGLQASEAEQSTSYRRNVGICLVNAAGLVFAARRCDDKSGTWQMPQGGIDSGENAAMAAARELREETGITSARIVSTIDRWLTYEFPTEVRHRMSGGISRFKGQTQMWMLMFFFGDDTEIDLQAHEEREFLEYQWMRLEDLPEKVVPFKAGVYAEVRDEFGPLIKQQQESQQMHKSWWSSQ